MNGKAIKQEFERI